MDKAHEQQVNNLLAKFGLVIMGMGAYMAAIVTAECSERGETELGITLASRIMHAAGDKARELSAAVEKSEHNLSDTEVINGVLN